MSAAGGIENGNSNAPKTPEHDPAPERTKEEIARMPMPPVGWVADDFKRNLVLSAARAAVEKGEPFNRIALSKQISKSDATITHSERVWTGWGTKDDDGMDEHDALVKFIRAIEYYEWAIRNKKEAIKRYYEVKPRVVTQRQDRALLQDVRKPTFDELTSTQKRIGSVLLREYRVIKKEKPETPESPPNDLDIRFLKTVAEYSGVGVSTLKKELDLKNPKGTGGATHLFNIMAEEEAKSRKP